MIENASGVTRSIRPPDPAHVELPFDNSSRFLYERENILKARQAILTSVNQGKPISLYGPAGVGKTLTVFDALQRLPEDWATVYVRADGKCFCDIGNLRFTFADPMSIERLRELLSYVKLLETPRVLVFDGWSRSDDSPLFKVCLDNYETLGFSFIAVSAQDTQVYPLAQKNVSTLTNFQVTSWTAEEFEAARMKSPGSFCVSDPQSFWVPSTDWMSADSNLNDRLANIPEEDLITLKFFFTGGNARFMMERTVDECIQVYLNEVKACVDGTFSSLVSVGGDEFVSHFVALEFGKLASTDTLYPMTVTDFRKISSKERKMLSWYAEMWLAHNLQKGTLSDILDVVGDEQPHELSPKHFDYFDDYNPPLPRKCTWLLPFIRKPGGYNFVNPTKKNIQFIYVLTSIPFTISIRLIVECVKRFEHIIGSKFDSVELTVFQHRDNHEENLTSLYHQEVLQHYFPHHSIKSNTCIIATAAPQILKPLHVSNNDLHEFDLWVWTKRTGLKRMISPMNGTLRESATLLGLGENMAFKIQRKSDLRYVPVDPSTTFRSLSTNPDFVLINEHSPMMVHPSDEDHAMDYFIFDVSYGDWYYWQSHKSIPPPELSSCLVLSQYKCEPSRRHKGDLNVYVRDEMKELYEKLYQFMETGGVFHINGARNVGKSVAVIAFSELIDRNVWTAKRVHIKDGRTACVVDNGKQVFTHMVAHSRIALQRFLERADKKKQLLILDGVQNLDFVRKCFKWWAEDAENRRLIFVGTPVEYNPDPYKCIQFDSFSLSPWTAEEVFKCHILGTRIEHKESDWMPDLSCDSRDSINAVLDFIGYKIFFGGGSPHNMFSKTQLQIVKDIQEKIPALHIKLKHSSFSTSELFAGLHNPSNPLYNLPILSSRYVAFQVALKFGFDMIEQLSASIGAHDKALMSMVHQLKFVAEMSRNDVTIDGFSFSKATIRFVGQEFQLEESKDAVVSIPATIKDGVYHFVYSQFHCHTFIYVVDKEVANFDLQRLLSDSENDKHLYKVLAIVNHRTSGEVKDSVENFLTKVQDARPLWIVNKAFF